MNIALLVIMNNKYTENKANSEMSAYFKEIDRYRLLTLEEEVDYARRVQKGDKDALESLINANLRLVVKIAKAYVVPEMNLMDLVQEGNMGLMSAARKFNPERGVRFSTYSSWWIKQSILRAVSWKRRSIRLPLRRENSIRYLMELSAEYTKELSHTPSPEELAAFANMSIKEVSQLLDWNSSPVSLDAEINSDGDTVMDIVENDAYNPEKILFQKNMIEETRNSIARLRENEKEILVQRYALKTDKKQTFKTIGKKMGVSPETVRQTELRALKKLRTNSEPLRVYLYN